MTEIGDWFDRNLDNLVIGLAFFIVGAILSWYLFVKQKNPKTLDYALIANQQVVAAAARQVSTLEVSWRQGDGRVKLEDPRFVLLRIMNTGKQHIEDEDFQQPITLTSNTGLLVEAVVTDVSEPGIHPLGPLEDWSEDSAELRLRPTLLNAGDWLDVQVVLDLSPEPPELTCWIKGQTREMRRSQGIISPPATELFRRAFVQVFSSPDSPLALGIAAGVAATVAIVGTLISSQ